jgi:hypothetical protein
MDSCRPDSYGDRSLIGIATFLLQILLLSVSALTGIHPGSLSGLEVRALITPSTASQVDLTREKGILWDKNGPFSIDRAKVDW